MRCCECEIEPVTPGHFCECCGRKLSLQERKALETATLAPVAVHAAHASLDRDDRLVGVHFTAQPTVDPVPAVHAAVHPLVDPDLDAHFAGHAPVETQYAVTGPVQTQSAGEASVWSAPAVHVTAHESAPLPYVEAPAEHFDSDASADRCEICGVPAQGENLCAACQRTYQALLENKAPLPAEAPLVSAVASVPDVAPSVTIASDVTASAIETSAEPVPVINVVKVKVAAAPQPTATAAPSLPKTPTVAKPVKPVAPIAAAMPPSRPPSRGRTFAAGAAVVVVVAAIGFPLGKLWLGHQEVAPIVREEQPNPPVAQVAAPAVAPSRVVQASATTSPTTSSAAKTIQTPPKAAAVVVVPPKPGVAPRAAAARVPSKTVLKPNASARPAAVAAIPSPTPAAPAVEVAAPAAVVAAVPKPPTPVAPVGPFFELRDVNETPRVASRVEPHLPDDLRDRPLNEVVIVRVLVTQTGHPLMVNLLRRSKAGPSLDDAIITAVKQWTFVPARKRGEAVSCWYHVGVPVIKAH